MLPCCVFGGVDAKKRIKSLNTLQWFQTHLVKCVLFLGSSPNNSSWWLNQPICQIGSFPQGSGWKVTNPELIFTLHLAFPPGHPFQNVLHSPRIIFFKRQTLMDFACKKWVVQNYPKLYKRPLFSSEGDLPRLQPTSISNKKMNSNSGRPAGQVAIPISGLEF